MTGSMDGSGRLPSVGRLGTILTASMALLIWPSDRASAQLTEGGSDSLAAAEAALDSGRVDRARALLEPWRDHEADLPRRERSRLLYLHARLTVDADSAEELYQRLAMEGDSRYGDRAWLRLAQLHLARGEADRARSELRRLRTDYPGSAVAAESWYWSGLASSAAGDPEAACAAWSRAADAGGEPAELAREELAGCRTGAGADRPPASEPGSEDPSTGYAAQLGAFSERAGARSLARAAREAGFQVRVVGPSPRDGLIRVRTNTVGTRAEADSVARRLKSRGLPGMVVTIEEDAESDGEVER